MTLFYLISPSGEQAVVAGNAAKMRRPFAVDVIYFCAAAMARRQAGQ
jgi:hypothetical protein